MSKPTDHYVPCWACEGDGVDYDAECDEPVCDGGGDDPCGHKLPDCDVCDGDGTVLWGWDDIDFTDCAECGKDAPCDRWGPDGDESYICLACARVRHAESCGCHTDGWS